MLDLTLDGSPVIVADEDTQPDNTPTGARPGARLPHAWLEDGVSLYDRPGTGFTLLVLDGEPGQATAIEDAAQHRGVPITLLDLSGHRLRDRYGADLVLVRPDQYTAWSGDRAPVDPLTLIDRVRGEI